MKKGPKGPLDVRLGGDAAQNLGQYSWRPPPPLPPSRRPPP